jgi:hypothetical protein
MLATVLNNFKYTYLFLSLEAELECCNAMLVPEPATAIMNSVTCVSEVCIGSVEMLLVDCGAVGISVPTFILTGYLNIQKFGKRALSPNQVLK